MYVHMLRCAILRRWWVVVLLLFLHVFPTMDKGDEIPLIATTETGK